jgi:hypothetical protein
VILDASSIGSWQSCHRRGILERDWRPHKWRGKALADAILRQGILAISQGMDAAAAAAEGRARFLQVASNPGLDSLGDTYQLAKEWCALIDTVLRGVVLQGLPKGLNEHPAVGLNSIVQWLPLSHLSEGMLHRWVTIDHWFDQDLSRELHSWRTLGDVATTRLPMTIHVIEIGQARNGRRHSSWTRGWHHPGLASLPLRFKRKDGKSFQGWKPVYLSESRIDPSAWVEQAWKEGALGEVMHNIVVNVPSEGQCAKVLSDILVESLAMRETEGDSWQMQPMSRNACDDWVPCPFQTVCYGDAVDVASLGFRPREQGAVSRTATVPRSTCSPTPTHSPKP